LNPVRARLVERPWQYAWSSARAHVRGRDDLLVKSGPMLERVDDWRDYLRTAVDGADSDLLRLHERTGRPLGSPGFIETLEATTGRTLAPRRRGPKPRRPRAGRV
jgi:putative transposase